MGLKFCGLHGPRAPWVWDSMGLELCGPGTPWAWSCVGLGLSGPGALWTWGSMGQSSVGLGLHGPEFCGPGASEASSIKAAASSAGEISK